jgi:ribose 5-phosphate isomerase A
MPRDAQKKAAAEAAVALVESGMVVGLGTGSTAAFAIDALIRRAREGLSIVCIPTSERSDEQARKGGLTLTTFATHPRVDVTIDGADEIARGSLNLIKGLGGALLREKIVAAATDRLVIVADETKLVDRLGGTSPVPVEVVPFGWETTSARIERLGGVTVLRCGTSGAPYKTDGGNLILDCRFGLIDDPVALEAALAQVIGVVETGLFTGMTDRALVASADGVMTLKKACAASA